MLVCRSAWQRLAPLTQRATTTLLRNAPARHMSASSVPGSTGENLPYYLFVGVAFLGGGAYAYRTVTRDRARFNERREFLEGLRPQFESGKDDSVTVETREVSETIEAVEEAAAEEVTEQEVVTTVSLEEAVTEQAVVPTVSLEQEVIEQEVTATISLEQEQPVAEEEASPLPSDDNVEVSAATPPEQEQESTEPVVEAVAAEISPVLEAISEDIPEELASAAEDWSELSARKPEDSVEENLPAEQESEEVVDAEVAASS